MKTQTEENLCEARLLWYNPLYHKMIRCNVKGVKRDNGRFLCWTHEKCRSNKDRKTPLEYYK